jgi:hypothetical protein
MPIAFGRNKIFRDREKEVRNISILEILGLDVEKMLLIENQLLQYFK